MLLLAGSPPERPNSEACYTVTVRKAGELLFYDKMHFPTAPSNDMRFRLMDNYVDFYYLNWPGIFTPFGDRPLFASRFVPYMRDKHPDPAVRMTQYVPAEKIDSVDGYMAMQEKVTDLLMKVPQLYALMPYSETTRH